MATRATTTAKKLYSTIAVAERAYDEAIAPARKTYDEAVAAAKALPPRRPTTRRLKRAGGRHYVT
jgi:hypothetical protein